MSETPESSPETVPAEAPPYAKDGGNIVLVAGILLIIGVLGAGLWLGTHDRKPPVEQSDEMTPEQRVAAADCRTCHAPDTKVAGPSFRQIAQRYAGDKGNDAEVARLVRKVKSGGSGVWGSTPMMAHPHLREAEIEVMVRWILSEYASTVETTESSTTTDTETPDATD